MSPGGGARRVGTSRHRPLLRPSAGAGAGSCARGCTWLHPAGMPAVTTGPVRRQNWVVRVAVLPFPFQADIPAIHILAW